MKDLCAGIIINPKQEAEIKVKNKIKNKEPIPVNYEADKEEEYKGRIYGAYYDHKTHYSKFAKEIIGKYSYENYVFESIKVILSER
jgi:hypothetical protein